MQLNFIQFSWNLFGKSDGKMHLYQCAHFHYRYVDVGLTYRMIHFQCDINRPLLQTIIINHSYKGKESHPIIKSLKMKELFYFKNYHLIKTFRSNSFQTHQSFFNTFNFMLSRKNIVRKNDYNIWSTILI